MNARPAPTVIELVQRVWRSVAMTMLLVVLTAVIGFGLYAAVENGVVIPRCRASGAARQLTFIRVESFGYRQDSSTHCIFVSASEQEQDVLFSDLSSFQIDLLASLALDVEITCPGIALLLAVAWSGFRLALRPHREEPQ